MATVNIEVIAQVADAVRGLAGVSSAFTDMHKANQDAAGALGVFGVSLTALDNPLTAVASGIKDSIDTTTRWAETIDKLSRASGESTEQTSKMAVVFGDFGINVDGLDRVVKTFTKNGLQFNMETMQKLAAEYQAIEDPVKRDKFAFDNFGRSAMEMTEILSKTPAELQAVGDAAMYSGKIMREQDVEAAQSFGKEMKQLGDFIDGVKIALGERLIPTLSAAAQAMELVLTWDKRVTAAEADHAMQVQATSKTYGEYTSELNRAAVAGGFVVEGTNLVKITYDEFGGVQRKVIQNNYELTQGQYDAAKGASAEAAATATATQALTDYAASVNIGAEDSKTAAAADDALAVSLGNAARAAGEANDKLAIQDGLMGPLTKQMIFHAASSALSAEGQLKLGLDMGIINKATYDTESRILAVNTALAGHKISEEDAIKAYQGAATQIGILTPMLSNMPGVIVPITGATQNFARATDDVRDRFDRLKPAIDHSRPLLENMPGVFHTVAGTANAAADMVNALGISLSKLTSKTITLTVNHVDTYSGGGAPPESIPQPFAGPGNPSYNPNPNAPSFAAQLRQVQANQSQYQGSP